MTMARPLLLVILVALALPALARQNTTPSLGDLSYQVPAGWSNSKSDGGVQLAPKKLENSQLMLIAIAPAEDYKGELTPRFQSIWKATISSQGFAGEAVPTTQTSKEGWSFAIGASAVAKDGKSILATLFVAQYQAKTQAIVILADSASTMNAHSDEIAGFLGSLSVKGYKKPETKTDAKSVWNATEGIVGVWWGARSMVGSNGLELMNEHLVFLPGGIFAFDLPIRGMDELDMGLAKKEQSKIWFTYSGNNDKGNVNGISTHPEPFGITTKGALSFLGTQYGRARCPSGYRLEGTYGVKGLIQQTTISFSADGKFNDQGTLAQCDQLSNVKELAQPGSGTYEIRNFSLILSYSDGRKAKISFYLATGPDAATSKPSQIVINRHRLGRF
ncbi:MAG: hypothetical protein IT203_08635 [Fimbriimonadaceae bacterium]|nr:hypothetical protein [Fimbriimonadaceae bacterium]